MSFKVYRDGIFDHLTTTEPFILPFISSIDPPPNVVPGIGGGIAYDTVTNQVYYNNGSMWKPISVTNPPSGVDSFSFVKASSQTIPSNTPTIVTNWSFSPSPPYSIIAGWNTNTGVYTAPKALNMSIDANISWALGISNQGVRYLRIVYFNSITFSTIVAKEMSTQGNPSSNINTPQSMSINLSLNEDDQVWIEVFHTAPVALQITNGVSSTLNGAVF
jgi:hypothetical protein